MECRKHGDQAGTSPIIFLIKMYVMYVFCSGMLTPYRIPPRTRACAPLHQEILCLVDAMSTCRATESRHSGISTRARSSRQRTTSRTVLLSSTPLRASTSLGSKILIFTCSIDVWRLSWSAICGIVSIMPRLPRPPGHRTARETDLLL